MNRKKILIVDDDPSIREILSTQLSRLSFQTAAAADGKVTDQTLLQRGVRPGVPSLYKSAFPTPDGRQPGHIYFSGSSAKAHFDVTLNNPLNDPSPAWKFKHELLEVVGGFFGRSLGAELIGDVRRDCVNVDL